MLNCVLVMLFCYILQIMHYKKPVFFVMFQKTRKNVEKNGLDVHKNIT
jgi:hypothetical protein